MHASPYTPLWPCTACAQDFFHSVQLNVNNPHFLIMQGRINKVQLCTAAALLLIREGGA